MCTLAWRQQQDKLWVCFNRDEQRSRPPAESPVLTELAGNPCIFARDPEGGGTWFAASSKGYVVALLNNYAADEGRIKKGRLSRGRLVLNLATAGTLEEACGQLDGLTAEDYSPFFLFLLSSRESKAWAWDGSSIEVLSPDNQFWTSSSYKPQQVQEHRTRVLEKLVKQDLDNPGFARELRRFDENAPEYGLTMDRESTRTVSQIELDLDDHGINFQYFAREPGGSGYLAPNMVSWRAGEVN